MTNRPTLHSLGMLYGTDKAHHHKYCDFYDSILSPLRDQPLRFFEIGIHLGASAKMWRDYFPNADLHIADIFADRAEHIPKSATFHQVDCESAEQLVTLSANVGQCVVILDDGGHTMWQQQLTLAHLWKNVVPGGFYIIEDLHTSFGYRLSLCNNEGIATTKSMIDHIVDRTRPFTSPAISAETLNLIREELESHIIWQKTPGVWDASVTCVLRKRAHP